MHTNKTNCKDGTTPEYEGKGTIKHSNGSEPNPEEHKSW